VHLGVVFKNARVKYKLQDKESDEQEEGKMINQCAGRKQRVSIR
jgi:hypothetical protein